MKALEYKKEEWSDATQFGYLKKHYTKMWENLFDIAFLGSLDKPLTPRILSDPNHKITKHLLYIYSMQSFVYEELNKACRDKS